MTFFELPSMPEPEEPHSQPAWIGPSDNEAGIVVPLNRVLVRNQDVAVMLLSATAFTTGFELTSAVRTREHLEDLHVAFSMHRRPKKSAELDPGFFRFGIEFADGRKATNLAYPGYGFERDEGPSQPVLMPRGSGGGGRRWDGNWWVWPLPSPGSLTVVCEWPAYGIELTRQELDAGALLDAAARVEPLWSAQ